MDKTNELKKIIEKKIRTSRTHKDLREIILLISNPELDEKTFQELKSILSDEYSKRKGNKG